MLRSVNQYHYIDGNLLISKKEIWDQMRRMSARYSTYASGKESAGFCVPPALFCVHRVQEAAGDGGWILLDGGQQACMQDRLRNSQTKRWEVKDDTPEHIRLQKSKGCAHVAYMFMPIRTIFVVVVNLWIIMSYLNISYENKNQLTLCPTFLNKFGQHHTSIISLATVIHYRPTRIFHLNWNLECHHLLPF